MSAFVIPLAVFLAVVFAVSAIGKLRAADRGSAAFSALQIPVRHPDAAAIALIALEGLVALGLVTARGWVFVTFAAAALVLTACLLVAVVRAYRLGATDDCGCFGEWMPAAIGPRLITRNVILTVAALTLVTAAFTTYALTGSPVGIPFFLASVPTAMSGLGALAAAALIAIATWSIVRASGSAPAAASAVGRGAGAVILPETTEIVDVLAPGTRARLIVFVSPGCHACETVLSGLNAAAWDVSALVDVYIVQRAVKGTADVRSSHPLPHTARFALDVGGSLGTGLGVGSATPAAALIGSDGNQAGPLAIGSDETALLIDSIRSLADAPQARSLRSSARRTPRA